MGIWTLLRRGSWFSCTLVISIDSGDANFVYQGRTDGPFFQVS